MSKHHSIRLIHATTDLALAQAIALRLQNEGHEDRSKIVLEGALLADYARCFVDREEESPAIDLSQLPARFDEAEITLHSQLLKLAELKRQQLKDGVGMTQPAAGRLLNGVSLGSLIDHVHKIRKAVTIDLYPHLANDPKALSMMIGPFS